MCIVTTGYKEVSKFADYAADINFDDYSGRRAAQGARASLSVGCGGETRIHFSNAEVRDGRFREFSAQAGLQKRRVVN